MHTWSKKPNCPRCVRLGSKPGLHHTPFTGRVISTSIFLQFYISKRILRSILKHYKAAWFCSFCSVSAYQAGKSYGGST